MKFEGTLAGRTQRLNMGMEYSVKATLEFSKKYKNYNYVPVSVSQDLPKSVNDQKKFLQSVCTPLQAETLLEQYPDAVQMIIDGRDGEIDLSKTKGIKEITFENIKNKVLDNYAISDLLVLLLPLGVSFNKVRKLLGGETNPTILKEKILDDPYLLSDIPGISFKVVDKIAIGMNPEFKISKKRVISFIKEYLRQYGEDNGSSWVLEESLRTEINNNISECEDIYNDVLEDQKQYETFLHIEEDKIGLYYYWWCEKEIYRILNEINDSEPLPITQEEIDEGIKRAEEQQKFSFTQEQVDILNNMTKKNLVVLNGFAGVGKSTITRGLLNIYSNYQIGCATLSARAAQRLQEVSGFEASTIHSMLGATGLNDFIYNENNKMPFELVTLDEFSMVFSGLFLKVFQAIKNGAKLVLVGDCGQLPPIGWGSLPTDILTKSQFQINTLTKIHRQAEKSGIIKAANLIRQGIDPLNGKKEFKTVYGELEDMIFMARADKEELNAIAIKTFLGSVKEIGIDNVQIIVPRKTNCINSTREINKSIQDLLLDNTLPYATFGEQKFKLGCKVLHIKNNKDLSVNNGEMGYVLDIFNMGENGGNGLAVQYPDKIVEYSKSDLKELELAYSVTCHKIQGGQSRIVIGIIDNSHFMLLDQTFLYTMLTRSQEKMLLLYQPFAYDKCISENKTIVRNTWMQTFN
jgi:exodeoxyribonuclease V alpha subunit